MPTPSPFNPSLANEEEIDLYSQGECHLLAVALHRQLGWQIEVIRQDNEVWWQDDSDADNFISAVLHVYAIDGQDNAWDIRGVRPQRMITAEITEVFGEFETSGDTCRSESELATYVGSSFDEATGEEVELPLARYGDTEVQQAWEVAQRVLGKLPGWGVALQAPTRSPRP